MVFPKSLTVWTGCPVPLSDSNTAGQPWDLMGNIEIILDPLTVSFSWGRENLSATGRQNECLSDDVWFS